ncbi:MAG: formylglycine-generating enzyme family protein [Phycisphaerae bacterium]|nr:formylglycine-generating enzyme family protein [Phycisphaerae bacterium]
MSNFKITLVFCLVLSLLFVAGYLASDRNAKTNKSTQNTTTNKSPDQYTSTNKAPDQHPTTNKAPDQKVTITKAPDKDLVLDLGRKATMKLALIPAGEFTMGSKLSAEEVGKQFGSKAEDHADEHPPRQVTISKPFYMGVTEVTQHQWKAVMGSQPWAKQSYTRDKADHAASYISWSDATTFCTKLSKKTGRSVRLPTEAEWEYACRAGTTTAFNSGDDPSTLGDYAWYRTNIYEKKEKYAHSVGTKKPNAWGLYDMHGNVYEWCADWYAKSYAEADTSDPKGPPTGEERVARGGSWRSIPAHCRAARRTRFAPGSRFNTFGFRVVVASGPGGNQ